MIPYLDRDLIRAFLLTFLTIAAFVQVGYFVSVLLEQSDYLFGAGESKLGWVLLFYVTTIPRQAAFTIPVATAVSVLWIYTTKARNNEILAYLVGGVSPVRLAMPMIVTGAVLSLLCYLAIELVANPADQYAYKIERINIQGRSQETLTRETNVFQKGRGNRFYNIRTFDPSQERMELPVIIDMGTDWNIPDWRLDAREAERVTSGEDFEWVFDDAVFRRWDEDGNLVEFRQEARLSESSIDVQLEDELTRYLRQRFKPSQMGTAELIEYIDLFKQQGKSTHVLESYLHFTFSIALGSLILTMMMCGHILRPSSAGVIVGFGGGLIIIAGYFIVLITCRQMAIAGTIPPPIAIHFPNALGFVVGVLLLRRYRAA